jgi:hypothetical protein
VERTSLFNLQVGGVIPERTFFFFAARTVRDFANRIKRLHSMAPVSAMIRPWPPFSPAHGPALGAPCPANGASLVAAVGL